ncbi:MAG: hypothetical protein ACREON_17885 [Gemmatimonadaceae bacterium]
MQDERFDERFEQLIRETAPTFNPPPEPPLDAMWARVEEAHFGSAGGRRRRRGIPTVWVRTMVGLAATLLVGMAIGRYTAGGSERARDVAPVTAAARVTEPPRGAEQPGGAYAATTTRYLVETAALLIAFPQEARRGRQDGTFVSQARDLLSTTRLLLDSPAASDPDVRVLLGDLELILAQIARLPARRDNQEVDLITEALEQREVLPRLRNVAAELPFAAGT